MIRDRSLDVAVTGMAIRLPEVRDPDDLWAALCSGTVLTTRMDRQHLLDAGVPGELVDDPDYVPVRGLLADADRFDNELFRISPREAQMMDPQHRMMLEIAWCALEDAGAAPTGDGPVTAVYASHTGSGYLRSMLTGGALDPATLDQAIHGTEPDFIASLISYKLGLTGLSLAVQTACSSGLVGVHLAVQALLNGECDRALVVAAGMDYPQAGHQHLPGGIQSPSGDCRPFDAAADGVVAGTGVVGVVLERCADLADGSRPHGIILGTAVNNDGSEKAGYYAPAVSGQEAVIRAAYGAADVDVRSVGYLETHGTGTRVGDPIEWSAASSALAALGARPGQIAVGAIKANTGHLDAAAGLASLVKALLVVREGTVPPVAGFRAPNPLLAKRSPLYVPTAATPWNGPLPRRAGVSSFGIGGTNAHVLIEQPPPVAPTRQRDRAHLAVLSAADPAALSRAAGRLREHLLRHPELEPADVTHTLVTGRAALTERLVVTARSTAKLAAALPNGVHGRSANGAPAPLVFLYPGQGAQSPGMALAAHAALPGFAAALSACMDAFEPALAVRLDAALLDPKFPAAELDDTALAQPALFALGYATTVALAQLGLRPSAVAGHSLGEITAACAAGVLDLPSAATLVAARGRAMHDCPEGAMLAAGLAEARARDLIGDGPVEIAAVNGPESCVLSGPALELAKLEERLPAGVFVRRLRTNRAFHSALVADALPDLANALATITLRAPAVPLVSGVDGAVLPAGMPPNRAVFLDGAREPVRFAAVLDTLTDLLPGALAVEIGPGRALSAFAEAAELPTIPLHPARKARTGGTWCEDEAVLLALGALWTRGQPVDLSALCDGGSLVHLPGYQFAGPRHLAPEVAQQATPRTEPAAVPAPSSCGGDWDTGTVLAGLWSELLGRHDLTEESDFFELGGDSLLITHLARRLNTTLGIRVPLREMLAGRTLGHQTTLLRELATASAATT